MVSLAITAAPVACDKANTAVNVLPDVAVTVTISQFAPVSTAKTLPATMFVIDPGVTVCVPAEIASATDVLTSGVAHTRSDGQSTVANRSESIGIQFVRVSR